MLPVVQEETQGFTQAGHKCGGREVSNIRQLVLLWVQTVRRDAMSQEINVIRPKDILSRVHLEPTLLQPLQDRFPVPQMLLHFGRPNDDVVDVASALGEIPEHLVHPRLEVRRRVLEHEP